jgi:predicted dehydrogenase
MTTPSPTRVAVIGCGLIATRTHLPAYLETPGCELAAVVSGHRENAETAASRFGVPRVLEAWQDAVADPDIDAIDICTPNALHAPIAIAAARAGKHVIVEKPMATSLADADAMIAAAQKHGVTLMVAHNLRFEPVYRAIHDIVQTGTIGQPLTARATFMHAGPDDAWGAASPWFWQQDAAGGGSLLDLGIHIIDALRWIIGRRVVEVTAMTARLVKPTFADDNAMLVLRFEGDILASVQSSWFARPVPDRQLMVHGDLGSIAIGQSRAEPLVLRLSGDDGPTKTIPVLPDRIGNPFSHFIGVLQGVEAPLLTAEDGRDALAVAVAAYESAQTGHVVAVR